MTTETIAQPNLFERLEVALWLQCERILPGVYRVTGGKEAHDVDLEAEGAAPMCDCGDFAFRGHDRPCKHVVACQLREGHRGAVAALGEYLDAQVPLLAGLGSDRPLGWSRPDPELDVTLIRYALKSVAVGGLADRGFVVARWPSGFELYRGPGELDQVPAGVRQLLAILADDAGEDLEGE